MAEFSKHILEEPLLEKDDLAEIGKINVRKMFLYCGVMGVVAAITAGGVFDNYLYVQTQSNATVGWAESLGGMAQLLCALPAGLLCDYCAKKGTRTWLMVASALIGMLACALNVVGFYLDYLPILYVALVVNGLSASLGGPSAWSLFADSIPQGNRAEYMAKITMVSTLTTGVGPFLGMAMFYWMGDTWDIRIMHSILIASNVGLLLGEFNFLGWRDVKPSADGAQIGEGGRKKKVSKYAYLVPYVMFTNDLITAVGAGMTVKFFPLFFANDYGFTPIQVQLTSAFVPLFMSPTVWLCERIARVIGRVQAGLLFNIIAVNCLFLLSYLRWTPAVIGCYIIRGAIQNAVYPIDMSVVMDFVPSDQRGKWSSLESLTSMTWTGSALIGGYLCDAHDYRYSFVITAYVYISAMFVRVPLIWIVPRQERFEDEDESVEGKDANIKEAVALLSSPIARSPRP